MQWTVNERASLLSDRGLNYLDKDVIRNTSWNFCWCALYTMREFMKMCNEEYVKGLKLQISDRFKTKQFVTVQDWPIWCDLKNYQENIGSTKPNKSITKK